MLILKGKKEIIKFLRENTRSTMKNKVEHYFFPSPNNRILLTAEHAETKKYPIKGLGSSARALFGDKNTGWLARLAAYNIRSGYVVPHFNRIFADAARDPTKLGLGVSHKTRILNGSEKTVRVRIHTDKRYTKPLMRYHSLIEEFSPSGILSVHGMHGRDKNIDILLGFGKKRSYIGGNKQAFAFRKEFRKRLQTALATDLDGYSRLGRKIKVAIGKNRFTGAANYVMKKHIEEFNEKNNGKRRLGVHTEFSSAGRKNIITADYQIAVQVLAETLRDFAKD